MSKYLETNFDEASESIGFLFWKTANLHQRLQRNILKELDLTPTQFSILASFYFLKKDYNEVTQALVCEHTSLDKMHVSDTTKALLKKNFICKDQSATDGRKLLINLTPEGKKSCNKAVKLIEKLDRGFFEKTEDVKTFHSMLKNLNE
jgi:DNA-binding MarR family transcriptional regulator